MTHIRNVKRPELVDFYHSYDKEKVSYSVYFARVKQQWMSKEEAIKIKQLKWKHMIKTLIDLDWRVCTHCMQYKTWDKFSKTKSTTTWRTPNCLECRQKLKKIYREATNYEKDREYKKKVRKLEIGSFIIMEKERYIDWLPREDRREVIKYVYKKWYMIKSTIDWIYRRIDMNDNSNKPKFYVDKQ